MITSPPAARMPWTSESIVVPLGSVSFATVAPTPPHVGVQPPLPTTNPRVKTLMPDCCWIVNSCQSTVRPMSTYGANTFAPGGGGGGPLKVVTLIAVLCAELPAASVAATLNE